MLSEVSDDEELMPATLNRKSRFAPVRDRISATRNSMLESESSEDTSHSMMWMFLCVFRAVMAERSTSPALERTPAMMVVDGSEASCRTNSRPIPRLAPVRKYVFGILRRDFCRTVFGARELRRGEVVDGITNVEVGVGAWICIVIGAICD